jgi:hypothetical protein
MVGLGSSLLSYLYCTPVSRLLVPGILDRLKPSHPLSITPGMT